MNKITHFAAYMMAISLTVLLPGLTWAADEDIAVSVYLTFDPVTGTLTEQPAKPPAGHNPALASVDVQATQVEPSGTAEPQSVVAAQAVQTGVFNAEQDPRTPGPDIFMVVGGIGVILVLVIGLFIRKYQQKPAS